MSKLSKINLMFTLSIVLIIFLGYFAVLSAQLDNSQEEIAELKEPKEKLTITTNQAVYNKDEIIVIEIKNLSEKSVWYIKDICPPSCCYLYRYENDQWKNLGNPMPCVQLVPP